MSSLSFLSKKSWHTGLNTNQERVWKAEKAALVERRKVDELRKERDRERELQELERLQEQAGGGGGKGKRQERVDWMYSAPAGGNNVDKNELEDYLLGKKRVDKLLQGDEKSQLARHGSGTGGGAAPGPAAPSGGAGDPTGLTGVNSDRDVASKIREDPMFAIRQQEQAAYQALLRDPARLRAMRKAAGMQDGEGESKEERKRRKEEKRRRKEGRHAEEREERSGSGRRHRDGDDDYRRSRDRDSCRERGLSSRHDEGYGRDSRRYDYAQDRRPRYNHQDKEYGRYERTRRHPEDRYEQGTRYPRDSERRTYDVRDQQYSREYDSRPYRHEARDSWRAGSSQARSRSPPAPRRPESGNDRRPNANGNSDDAAASAREAKLAAMQKNAVDLTSSRQSYLDKVQAEEAAELARDESLRIAALASRGGSKKATADGFGTEPKGSFLVAQERSLYGAGAGMDLGERLRRGRDGLQRFQED